MPKEFLNPKFERAAARARRCCSEFRASSFFRHSSFIIRHSTASGILVFLLLLAQCPIYAAPINETPDRLLDLEFQLPTSPEKNSDQTIHLRGKDARQQLLLTAKSENGALRD